MVFTLYLPTLVTVLNYVRIEWHNCHLYNKNYHEHDMPHTWQMWRKIMAKITRYKWMHQSNLSSPDTDCDISTICRKPSTNPIPFFMFLYCMELIWITPVEFTWGCNCNAQLLDYKRRRSYKNINIYLFIYLFYNVTFFRLFFFIVTLFIKKSLSVHQDKQSRDSDTIKVTRFWGLLMICRS